MIHQIKEYSMKKIILAAILAALLSGCNDGFLPSIDYDQNSATRATTTGIIEVHTTTK